MDSNDLKIFQVVAYEKSISKAAIKLGYAQSNITMRIKYLEKQLSTTLFRRNNKGTLLTPQGENLLVYADKILELMDKINEEFLPSNMDSRLKIGATQTISASVLPKLFSLLHEKNPEISLTLKTDKQENLLDLLIKGEIDGAFIFENDNSSKIKEIFNFSEESALISPNKITDINNLASSVIINSDINCPYHKLMKKWLNSTNLNSVTTIEFDTLDSIIKGIAEGLGISLLPKSILPKDHSFFIYDLKGDFNKVTIKFVVNKDIKINTSLKSFINITQKYLVSSTQ